MTGGNSDLKKAESGIHNCPKYGNCSGASDCKLTRSKISPGAKRRGHRNPKVLLLTEAPDEDSSQGTAYQGSISGRIENIFCNEEYGIGLDRDTTQSFQEFLREYRFYATSAVKCCISEGSGSDVGSFVINNCTKQFLREQIEAMGDLELIVPMGKVATAAILRQNPKDLSLISIMGRSRPGFQLNNTHWGGADIVVLPHPSGASPLSNPPIVKESGNRQRWQQVTAFRGALESLRERLDSNGYDVLDGNPNCWDSPEGLSGF